MLHVKLIGIDGREHVYKMKVEQKVVYLEQPGEGWKTCASLKLDKGNMRRVLSAFFSQAILRTKVAV